MFLKCFFEKQGSELTDKEKTHTKRMVGLIDIPLNEDFFNNMNNTQIKYLLSIVDMQDTQHSYSYGKYVRKLEALAKLKKIQ